MTLSKEDYAKRVLDRHFFRKAFAVLKSEGDVRSEGLIRSDVERMWRDCWSVYDAVSFLVCTEELNPEMPEDIALRRMSEIQRKYEQR